jgi:uncharacterized protein DUF3592
MRIFPKGWEQASEPLGTAFVIFAKMLLGVAILAFCWRGYEFVTWHRTEGEVIEAHETTSTGDNGETLFSAEYTVRFAVQGAQYTVGNSPSFSSGDARWWKQYVTQLPGTKQAILYNPRDPSQVATNGGKSASFFLAAIVPGGLGVAFWIAGKVSIFRGRRRR